MGDPCTRQTQVSSRPVPVGQSVDVPHDGPEPSAQASNGGRSNATAEPSYRAKHSSLVEAPSDLISLTEAANLAPGRPSTNCIWRWARKGVRARSGERVRLKHVRAGSRLFTKTSWMLEFFQRLAEADARHFDEPGHLETQSSGPEPAQRTNCDPRPAVANETDEELERELLHEGFSA